MIKRNMRILSCFIVILLLATTPGYSKAQDDIIAMLQEASTNMTRGELHIGVTNPADASVNVLDWGFAQVYSEVKVIYHLYTEEQLRAELMLGEQLLDIVILPTAQMDIFAQAGYLENMVDAGLISEWPAYWMDMRALFAIDGNLYGVPKAIYQDFFTWNNDLAEYAKVKKPELIWTWEDLENLSNGMLTDVNGDGTADLYMMYGIDQNSGILVNYIDYFILQYHYEAAAGQRKYEDERFYYLLQLFNRIASSGKLLSSVNVDLAPQYNGSPAVLINIYSHSSPVPQVFFCQPNESILYFPVLEREKPQYKASGVSYCLLKNAPNKAVALDYLALRVSPDLNRVFYDGTDILSRSVPQYELYDPMGSTPPPFMPDGSGGMIYLVEGMENLYVQEGTDITAEEFEDFIFVREHSVSFASTTKAFYRLFIELAAQYIKGTISEQDIGRQLDAQQHMMANE